MAEFSDTIRDLYGSRDAATQGVVGHIDASPDDAARAIELGEATGVAPSIISGDLETFEKRHKQSLASGIVSSNNYIADYVNSHPLAAQLSNDDYGNLDAVSQKLGPFAGFGRAITGTIAQKAIEGFKAGFGEGGVGSWMVNDPNSQDFIKDHPLSAATTSVLASPVELTLRSLSGIIKGATDAAVGGAEELYKQLGGSEGEAKRFSRDVGGVAEMLTNAPHHFTGAVHPDSVVKAREAIVAARPWIDAGVEPPLGVHPLWDEVKTKQSEADLKALDEALKEAQASKTKERSPEIFASFIRQHTDAKIGISGEAIAKLYGDKPPIADDGKLGWVSGLGEKLQSALATGGDVEIPLADWLSKVDPAIAKELHDDVRVRPGGVTKNEVVAISEQRPKGEGKTPFEEGMEEFAAKNNLPPLTDEQRLSNIESRIGQIERDRRATKVEGEDYPPHAELSSLRRRASELRRDTTEAVRQSSSLQPLFQTPKERKLTLRRAEEANNLDTALDRNPNDSHAFEITDESGNVWGELFLGEEKGGKHIYIDDVRGVEMGGGTNKIGPSAMRDLLRQLKAEFPNAETLGGYRVSGARDKAGSWEKTGSVSIKLDQPEVVDLRKFTDDLFGTWEDYGMGLKAYVKPTDFYSKHEEAIVTAVNKELERIVPKQLEVHEAQKIERNDYETYNVLGAHIMYQDRLPIIVWALEGPHPVRTARHEALHHLRQQGFFTKGEWATLMNSAIENGWLEKHNINERYKGLSSIQKVEEAIADEFSDWNQQGKIRKAVNKLTGNKLDPIFQKLKEILDAVRSAVNSVLGKDVSFEELFNRADAGEIGSREGNKPIPGDAFRESRDQPELPGTRRLDDRELFEQASAVGMTVDQYKRYMKLIEKRNAEDVEALTKRAMEDQRRKQTKTWKENEAEVRKEVVEDIKARPDVAADEFFRDARIYGRKAEPTKLDSAALSDEQKAGLPKSYYGKDGIHPDSIAGLFGYPDGNAMVGKLVELQADRKQSGMRPEEYTRRLISAETERRMQAKYGNLAENILADAKEQVLSETQLDLLHEDVLHLGLKNGTEFSITKDQMKAWVKDRFDALQAEDISVDKFFADMGRAGRAKEDFHLKEKWAEAFREAQRQQLAFLYAREAKDFEKAKEKFDKLAERLTRREVKTIDKDFVNWSQDLLLAAGYDIKRNVGELRDSLERSGYKTLDSFIDSKIGDGWELGSIPAEIREKQVKPIEQMSVKEFNEFSDAVDSLAHVGREVKLIDIAGQKMEVEEFKAIVLDNIRSLPVRDKNKPKRFLYWADAALTRMEEIAKDLDLRQELGPLFNALIRPMAEAKHTEYSMLEKLAKDLRDIRGGDRKWVKSLDDSINQNFLIDPYDGTPYDLSRQHMIGIMLNFGTRSNIDKFVRGYIERGLKGEARTQAAASLERNLTALFDRHATKADWEYVQNIWDLFEGWKKDSAKLYYDLSGRQPKWIEAQEVATRHGNYRGGYYPIIYDRLRSNIGAVEEKVAPNAMFGPNYFRASPANHYAKERTGYVDYVQFENTIEQVASRMQQMIHDISYRRQVMDASKVIYDRDIRAAMRKHYGTEYEAQLDPWLKDIANHFNQDEVGNSWANWLMRRARTNLVAHALGLNLKVIGSPDIGRFNPVEAASVIADREANTKLAWEKSREIPHTFRNMDRDFRERLEQTIASRGWDAFQADAVRWSFWPTVKFSQGFRIITFVSEYKKGLADGLADGDAVARADSLVRERHGAAGLPDLPAIMRGSEAMKVATIFYGYFSTMYNWQRQLPGNVKRGEVAQGLGTLYGSVLVGAAFGGLLFNQQKESDSWWKTIAKALLLQPAGTIPFMREAANWLVEGNPSRSPIATMIASFSNVINDARRAYEGKKVDKPIQHTGNVVGLTLGLPLAQVSRTGQFFSDVFKGQQRPRNIQEWARGVITGTARLKK